MLLHALPSDAGGQMSFAVVVSRNDVLPRRSILVLRQSVEALPPLIEITRAQGNAHQGCAIFAVAVVFGHPVDRSLGIGTRKQCGGVRAQ